jgi:hypothetical protein
MTHPLHLCLQDSNVFVHTTMLVCPLFATLVIVTAELKFACESIFCSCSAFSLYRDCPRKARKHHSTTVGSCPVHASLRHYFMTPTVSSCNQPTCSSVTTKLKDTTNAAKVNCCSPSTCALYGVLVVIGSNCTSEHRSTRTFSRSDDLGRSDRLIHPQPPPPSLFFIKYNK